MSEATAGRVPTAAEAGKRCYAARRAFSIPEGNGCQERNRRASLASLDDALGAPAAAAVSCAVSHGVAGRAERVRQAVLHAIDDGVLPGGADPHDEVTARILSDQGADPGLKRAIADLNRKQAGQLAEARQDGGQ